MALRLDTHFCPYTYARCSSQAGPTRLTLRWDSPRQPAAVGSAGQRREWRVVDQDGFDRRARWQRAGLLPDVEERVRVGERVQLV